MYIREWGRLVCKEKNHQHKTDEIHIKKSTFDELAKYAEDTKHKYISFVNTTTLKVKNYVGIITTKDGTQIEILPKTSEKELDKEQLQQSRDLILTMLNTIYHIKSVKSTTSHLTTQKDNLHEALITWFLSIIKGIVKKGVRSDYHRVEAHEKFLKGQLQLQKQVNEPPHRQHLFYVQYDVFSTDRAENRLIHSALLIINRYSRDLKNKQLIKELLLFFDKATALTFRQYKSNFDQWQINSKDRSMKYYQDALPFIKLILNQKNPFTQQGQDRGISFLLPMETLFEQYVTEISRQKLPDGFALRAQDRRYYLAESNNTGVFQLRPDIVISKDGKCVVLDAKWKLINEKSSYENGNENKKKDISQADMYQLFAYGKKYHAKKVVLIYPKWGKFEKPFSFDLGQELQLDVVPFSLPLDKNTKTLEFELDFLSE